MAPPITQIAAFPRNINFLFSKIQYTTGVSIENRCTMLKVLPKAIVVFDPVITCLTYIQLINKSEV